MKKFILALSLLGLVHGGTVLANEVAADTEEKGQVTAEVTAAAEVAEEEKVVGEQTDKAVTVPEESVEPVAVDVKAEEDVEEEAEQSEFVKKYISGKLQIGTRSGHHVLTDDDSGHEGGHYGSGTFLGTIYALDVEQDYVPKYLFLRYFFTKYVGAEIAYDSVSASTVATSIGYSGIKTDGEVTVYGPTISLVAAIPNSSKFTPYGSFGVGFYSGDFDEAAHWGLGYRDPSQYEAMGSPSTPYGGRTRTIEIDSEVGLTMGVGCSYDINDHWLVDLSMQYTTVDVDATFYGYTNGVQDTEQTGHFPMDNVAFRFGVAYRF